MHGCRSVLKHKWRVDLTGFQLLAPVKSGFNAKVDRGVQPSNMPPGFFLFGLENVASSCLETSPPFMAYSEVRESIVGHDWEFVKIDMGRSDI